MCYKYILLVREINDQTILLHNIVFLLPDATEAMYCYHYSFVSSSLEGSKI